MMHRSRLSRLIGSRLKPQNPTRAAGFVAGVESRFRPPRQLPSRRLIRRSLGV
jgi:hypothetical protein